MKPDRHREYVKTILSRISVDSTQMEEILTGCIANDYCESTSEWDGVLKTKEAIGSILVTRRNIFANVLDNLLIYRSHFGDLAALHCMASESGEAPETTMQEIRRWEKFFAQVGSGAISLTGGTKLKNIEGINVKFQTDNNTVEDLFDANDPNQIRYRAIGALVHMIEDYYTPCHVELTQSDEAVKFLCYRDQSRRKHDDCDKKGAPDEKKSAMMRAIQTVVTGLLDGNSSPATPFAVSSNAMPADGGNHV